MHETMFCNDISITDILGVPADPKLAKDAQQSQPQKTTAELAEAAQKLRDMQIGESIPKELSQQPQQAASAAPAEQSQPPVTKAVRETAAATATPGQPAGQQAGQQPAQEGMSAAHVQQQVAAAFQQPPNPFSSAFAYTERMNSAFSSN